MSTHVKTNPLRQGVLNLSQLALRLGVGRQRLTEWVQLGLLPTPLTLGQRRNGRPTSYVFLEADLPRLADLVKRLKKRGVRR